MRRLHRALACNGERGLIRRQPTMDEVFDIAHDLDGVAAVEFEIHHVL